MNSMAAQEWCDSTYVACDSVFLDSIWITHHPQYGDRLQVRIRTEHEFLHGPIFRLCPTEDSVQFLDNSFPFFGIMGPASYLMYYQFQEFNFSDETITGELILDNTANPFPNCIISFSITVSDTTTALNDDIFENEIEIYPNPADYQLTIKLQKENSKINTIQLFDLMGKRQQISTNGQSVDLRQLPVGMYILQIDFDNEKSVIKKVFKK